MSRGKKFTEDEIFSILKRFTIECVHGGDFDQGNSESDTIGVLKNWWNKRNASNELFSHNPDEEELLIKYENIKGYSREIFDNEEWSEFKAFCSGYNLARSETLPWPF